MFIYRLYLLVNIFNLSPAPNTMSIHEKVLGRSEVFHQGQWFCAEKMRAQNLVDRKEKIFVPGAKEKYSEVQKVLGKELAGNGVKKFKNGVMTQSGGNIL